MKMPFGLSGKNGKKLRQREWSEEDAEFLESFEEYEEEYSEAEAEYVGEYYEAEAEYVGEYYEAEAEYEGEYYEADEYTEESYEEEVEYEEEPEEYPTMEMTGIFPTEEMSGLFETESFEEIRYEGYEEVNYEEEPYYEEGSYNEVGSYYAEAPYYEEEEEEERAGIFMWMRDSALADRLLAIGGIAVLLLVLIVGFVFIGGHMLRKEEDGLLNVGGQIAHIVKIGESGLLAVSDAQKAAIEAAEMLEQEQEEQEEPSIEYEEEEYKVEVNVKLSMSSIEKDLKIKFINEDTGKLVGNVPFEVEVSGPDGKKVLWSDDDMDGIIYKKNLAAGSYKITINEFSNEKYKKYGIPVGQHKVQVKEKIDYNKVDVSDEVKSESQVDVQKEDTKKNETVVEGYLPDTVPWVESTATLLSFSEVAKSNIPDPMPADTNTTALSAQADPVVTIVSGGDAEGTLPADLDGELSPMVVTLDKSASLIYMDFPVEISVKAENISGDAVVTAESSDGNVLTATINNNVITFTGVAAGKANVTVNCSAEVEEKDPETLIERSFSYQIEPIVFEVEVKENPQKDTKTVLLDKEENEVYVPEGNDYRVASVADYYVQNKFFLKGEAKYTGWQTLEGKRYFFDASGEPVTGEQVIQGVKYTFSSDGVLITGDGTLGIDVSKWNGMIDWTAVKNSGVSYVIIRCGYRGSTEGALIKDSKFDTNIQGAINAGLKVGVYFFTQAVDKNEALEEASMVLDCVKKYKITYPIFLDVEPSGGRADGLDAATRTEVCKTFCETIQKYGYTAGIYANKNWLTDKINTSELSSSYKIWLAQYASAPTYTGRFDMWQYKATGKINGINGDVDLNLSYLGY